MREGPISVSTVLGERLYRNAVGRFLESIDHILLQGQFPLAAEHVETVVDQNPCVAVIEVSTHRLSTYDFLSTLTRNRPAMAIVALAISHEPWAVDLAFRLGARGVITTDADLPVLVRAIETVARGEMYGDHRETFRKSHPVPQGTGGHRLRNAASPSPTPREQEVLDLTAEGYTSYEIGEVLHISARTVENHLQRLRKKFDVPNKAALIKRAYDRGALP